MKILGYILFFVGLVFLIVGLFLWVLFLVVFFLKIIFCIFDFKVMLKFELMVNEFLRYDLFGLVEWLKKIVIFIDVVDEEEYVDELIF